MRSRSTVSSHGGASRAHRTLAVNEGGAARAHIRAAVTSAWGQSGHGDGSGCGSRRARRVFSGRGDYSLDRPDVICRGHGVGVRGAPRVGLCVATRRRQSLRPHLSLPQPLLGREAPQVKLTRGETAVARETAQAPRGAGPPVPSCARLLTPSRRGLRPSPRRKCHHWHLVCHSDHEATTFSSQRPRLHQGHGSSNARGRSSMLGMSCASGRGFHWGRPAGSRGGRPAAGGCGGGEGVHVAWGRRGAGRQGLGVEGTLLLEGGHGTPSARWLSAGLRPALAREGRGERRVGSSLSAPPLTRAFSEPRLCPTTWG